MSKKSDIIDGSQASSARNGLAYTCRLGWLDLGHARPDNAKKLWDQIVSESGQQSTTGKGFRVSFGESMSTPRVWGMQLTKSVDRAFFVAFGLSVAQKEEVALAIFIEVSFAFETMQSSFPYKLATDSGFSGEDLVSNLVGFYRAVRPQVDYFAIARPVSKSAAVAVWDQFGSVGSNKNHSFAPMLYPCSECGSDRGATCGELPEQLNQIQPANKGELFRDWDTTIDESGESGLPAEPADGGIQDQTPAANVGEGAKQVEQGQCVYSIAQQSGHLWKTLWDAPENKCFADAQRQTGLLLPGDKLHVPEIRLQSFDASTGGKSRYVRKGLLATLRLQLCEAGKPRKGVACRLDLGTSVVPVNTDGGGWIEALVSPLLERAVLSIDKTGEVYELLLKQLNPVEHLTGVQARLNSLGYPCGAVDGKMGPQTRAAVRLFQGANKLKVDGIPGSKTQAKLKELYGS